MDLAIQRLNGVLYDLKDYNVQTLDFQIAAPSPRNDSEEIEGMDGVLDSPETTYDPRLLRGSFTFTATDNIDFALVRNEIFRMFSSKEAYYLIDSREPGKRWLVRSNGFPLEQLKATRGRFDVDFIASYPYAESIMNTLDPNMAAAQISGTGSRIQSYRHTTATFEIFNDSDTRINPRKHPLEILFKGASTNLIIRNITTGDEWAYTGNTTADDTIRIQGIRSTKNGLSIFRNTNHQLITLQEGWNDFELVGTSDDFEITFDFRFYTL